MNYQRFPHSKIFEVKNKPFKVYWSKAAERAFNKLTTPLLAEMELKFACMVRMRVLFHENVQHHQSLQIHDKLSVLYRPVLGNSCSLSEAGDLAGAGELRSGPMASRHPKQLGIDFVRGEWKGEYS